MDEKLRAEGPVSNVVHDLLQTLNEKIDAATRYGLYVENAEAESCAACVAIFRQCERHDRDDVARLLDHLRGHVSSVSAGVDAWANDPTVDEEGAPPRGQTSAEQAA